MRLLDIWNSKKKPTVSFELFPARTPKSAVNLEMAIDRLADLKPDFVSVTFGAGGSTRKGSSELVEKLKNEKGLEILAYVACYGMNPEDLANVLEEYDSLGVENILAVRGDSPREIENFQPHPDSLAHATDFVAFIKPSFNFCLGAAGYPEGHIEAESKEKDLEYLKLKVENGAEYIIANYFYDNNYFFDFRARCRKVGINVPIIPGIMPIFSVKMMQSLARLCGATITAELKKGLTAFGEDDKAGLLQFGIDFALKQCRKLLEEDVPGIHIYTMDRSKSTVEIVNRLRDDGLL